MPSTRPACRSASNTSSPSIFSETPANLIGAPVICRTESAAPPRESPSSLVRMMPVSGSASLKALAVFTASCPCIASTTKSVSTGLIAAWSSLISRISASSMASRPAVSTSSTSKYCFLAWSSAARAMSTGFWSGELGNHSAPACFVTVFSCSIAAGR